MLAFHSDPSIKARYLDRVRRHRANDEIIHGKYWENGKGCAVGCCIHSSNHMAYESELGIPIMLARLEDRLFEGLANGRSKEFPERFLLAARLGADLSLVGWKFLHWLLTEELASRDDPRVADQIKRCADVLVPLTKGEPCDKASAAAASAAAASASYAAASASAAAASASASAADAYAASASSADAYAAAASAAAASAAAASAAASASADASADAYGARQKCYEHMAEKLLELMAECPGEPIRVAMGAVA